MQKTLLKIILIFLCSINACFAVQVANLYSTSVPVTSQSQAQQHAALRKAMAQVFVKLSGSSTVIQNPNITAALNNPESALLSYSYQDETMPNGDTGLFLNADFDPQAMVNFLESAQQTIWGQNRPLVLVWLAYGEGNQKEALISSTTQNDLTELIHRDASLRGLPILFPSLDLKDTQVISVKAIESTNLNLIQQASVRYGSDAILVINLVKNKTSQKSFGQSSEQWSGQWTLLAEGNTSQWQTQDGSLAQTIKQGIDEITDKLALQYGVASDQAQQNEIQLTVVNVQSLDDYAKVSAYLKSLLPVKQVELAQIKPSALIYNLKVVGGEGALQKALSLDHRLQPVTVAPSFESSGIGLVYQWNL